jgi:hypothetical protein
MKGAKAGNMMVVAEGKTASGELLYDESGEGRSFDTKTCMPEIVRQREEDEGDPDKNS